MRADVAPPVLVSEAEDFTQRIGLERDLQATLRLQIEQLEPGLRIIDDGAERFVESDFDRKTIAAASMAPSLTLKRYAVTFRFSEIGASAT